MENGKWKMENGKWRMENLMMTTEGTEHTEFKRFHVFPLVLAKDYKTNLINFFLKQFSRILKY